MRQPRPGARRCGLRAGQACLFLLVLAGGFFRPTASFAQGDAHSVTAIQTLAFGDLFTGDVVQILPTAPEAAKFTVVRTGGKGSTQTSTVTFSLPSSLQSGGNTLSVSFGSTSGRYSFTDNPATGTSFDPTQGFSVGLRKSETLYVWVGGTVSATPVQQSGAYTGLLTVDATN